jgi:Arc/MetJ-type ribon-helix-helix transcriptional regulator
MAKITITLEAGIMKKLDRMIGRKVFPNRSKAIQKAVKQKLSRMDKDRLARDCAKLDAKFESGSERIPRSFLRGKRANHF